MSGPRELWDLIRREENDSESFLFLGERDSAEPFISRVAAEALADGMRVCLISRDRHHVPLAWVRATRLQEDLSDALALSDPLGLEPELAAAWIAYAHPTTAESHRRLSARVGEMIGSEKSYEEVRESLAEDFGRRHDLSVPEGVTFSGEHGGWDLATLGAGSQAMSTRMDRALLWLLSRVSETRDRNLVVIINGFWDALSPDAREILRYLSRFLSGWGYLFVQSGDATAWEEDYRTSAMLSESIPIVGYDYRGAWPEVWPGRIESLPIPGYALFPETRPVPGHPVEFRKVEALGLPDLGVMRKLGVAEID